MTAAEEERAAREQLRHQQKMHRGAARARQRSWRERLRDAMRETRTRYPRCKCALHCGMTREELRDLASGCTAPDHVCPRLDTVRRRMGF
jgi:hypothetical protein